MVYTALRLVLFAATFGVVAGLWLVLAGSAPWFWVVVIAFVVSGIGSWFVLNRQRAAFAERVEVRAERATKAFDERRAREDAESD